MKKTLLFVLVLLILFSLTGCRGYEGYNREDTDLYTIAIYNVLGNFGYYNNGEVISQPDIDVIEEDDYGRKLFSYFEGSAISTYSLLMLQFSDDEYVYYYEDSFISSQYNDFSDSDIETLKSMNDWNKVINLNKAVKVKITKIKEDSPFKISEDDFEILFKALAKSTEYLGDDTIYRFSTYFSTDDFGRTLYYAYGVGRDVYGIGVSPDSTSQYFNAVIIFNPDGTYNENTSIKELSNLYNYQHDLKLFKELNQWNEEWSKE